MKLEYLLYVTMLLGSCSRVHAEYTYKTTDKLVVCSDRLSDVIKLFCDRAVKIVKRDTSVLIDKIAPKTLQDAMNKQRLLSAETWRRVRRQVATECCDQPCTVGNIIMYCPDGTKLVEEDPDIFS